jgi:Ricin-type beta-trefoil lectin domain/Cellulase (glycosyl hydrolase family 5)
MNMTFRHRRMQLFCILSVLLTVIALVIIQEVHTLPAHAATNQFHGVNWANPNDNFVTGDLVPVGLSTADSYATTYTKATAILKGFQSLGANTVRLPFNAATTSGSWWNSYIGAMDAASALGMNVVVAPWLQNGTVSDTTSFYQMWDTMINKYGGNSHFYFDIMNEPWAYSATNLTNFEAAWLARYPSLPRGRVIVPGLYSDNNLCAVGADSRLSGTLLSIHIYGMFGTSFPTEAGWVTDFENNLCGYASRAVLTEFGVPMNTGANYDGPRDGNNDLSYMYGITDTVRNLGMGSILWTGVKQATQTVGPGPCENASCAITSLNGSGTNLSLSVTNQSGLDRLQYGWGGGTTPTPTPTSGGGGGTTGVLRGVGSNRCLDVPGVTTANGTLLQIYDCNGGANQQWTSLSNGELQVYGTKCLDVPGFSTTPGTKVQIWDCNGGTNQQWTLNSNGTVVGRGSGLCLDVTGAGTANHTAVDIQTCNGGSNQKWVRQ